MPEQMGCANVWLERNCWFRSHCLNRSRRLCRQLFQGHSSLFAHQRNVVDSLQNLTWNKNKRMMNFGNDCMKWDQCPFTCEGRQREFIISSSKTSRYAMDRSTQQPQKQSTIIQRINLQIIEEWLNYSIQCAANETFTKIVFSIVQLINANSICHCEWDIKPANICWVSGSSFDPSFV